MISVSAISFSPAMLTENLEINDMITHLAGGELTCGLSPSVGPALLSGPAPATRTVCGDLCQHYLRSTGASQHTGLTACLARGRHCSGCFRASSPSSTARLARNLPPFPQKGNRGTEPSDDSHKALCSLGFQLSPGSSCQWPQV